MNQESNEKAGEDPNESSTEETAAKSVEVTAAETAGESEDESIKGSAEESGEESEDESIEGSADESDEESEDESIEESTEESVEKSEDESIEGSTEESVEESTGELAADSAGALAGEASEDTSEQVPDGDGGEGLPVIHGSVKWFNAEKGFGFIVADDGSGDVFLHLSALRSAGLETVSGGATIVCAVSRGPKGLQVDRVIEVDESTASPTSVEHRPRSPLGYDRPRHPPLTEVGEFVVATVKWFNPNKGFGFITVDETSPDVFVHMQTLRRCGVATLDSGQEVRVRIGQGAKGPQVAEIDVG